MKNITKILGVGIIMCTLLTPVLFLKAESDDASGETKSIMEERREEARQRMETAREAEKNREFKFEDRQDRREDRASTSMMRFDKREDNIERIRERMSSTTASTSVKRMKKLEDRFEKQKEQREKAKDRLLNRELKVTEVLGKIADKIEERITILEGKGLNMTDAKSKLAEAESKIEEVVAEGEKLADLIETEITDTNKEQLFSDIKASQEKLRTLARSAHSLLVDTVKEITEVLPIKTTTATSTI